MHGHKMASKIWQDAYVIEKSLEKEANSCFRHYITNDIFVQKSLAAFRENGPNLRTHPVMKPVIP